MKIAIIIFCSLSMSACAPMIISDTTSGNTIKYDPFVQKRADVDALANKMCARYGKKAVLIRSQNETGIGHNLDNYECK